MFSLDSCTLSYVKEAPFRFENTLALDAPPDAVFGLLAGSDETWFPEFRSTTWLTSAPHGVGSVRDFELSYLRLREHFVAWEPGRRLAFYAGEMSLPLADRFFELYELSPIADGRRTCLEWSVCYEPRRYVRPLHPPLRPFFKRQFEVAAAALKAYAARP